MQVFILTGAMAIGLYEFYTFHHCLQNMERVKLGNFLFYNDKSVSKQFKEEIRLQKDKKKERDECRFH